MDLPKRLPLLLPPVAVLVAAVVFLGPGAKRPSVSVRVRGAVTLGARALALRIEGVRSHVSIEDAASLDELDVEALLGERRLTTTTARSGASGIVEARLETQPLTGPIALRVTSHASGKLIAQGTIEPAPARPIFTTIGALQGSLKGDLPIRADVDRGVLAAPFPERITISVGDGKTAMTADIEATITGGAIALDEGPMSHALDGKTTLAIKTNGLGVASIRVQPLAHESELSLRVRAGDRRGTWEGVLPVVPGAIWARATSDGIELISPSPRSEAYISLWDDRGRFEGAVVPLAKDDLGFFRGTLRPAHTKDRAYAAMTVASDPFERGPATVGWPLQPPSGAAPLPRLSLLIDGVPAALEREKARAYAARRAGALWLGAAALVEVLLVLAASRTSQRKLEGHLASASGSEGEADALDPNARADVARSARAPVLRALLLVAVIALAFAGVGVLAVIR